MAVPKGNNFANTTNLGLTDSLGIQFTGRTADPTDSDLSTGRLYFNSTSGAFKWYNGTSWQTLGTGGGGPIPSWETIFANDTSFGITAGTWTISQSSANAIITLNKTNVGAGNVIDITNSGSGADIANGSAWAILASGGVGVFELGSGGSINSTSGAMTLGKSGTATTFAGTVVITGAAGTVFTITQGNTVLTSGNLTLTSGNAVLTSGNLTLSAGQQANTSTSNAAASLSVTNNTITSYGSGGTSTGMVLIRSTSITTGALLRLQAAEGTITGSYLSCWDSVGGAAVFSVGAAGATVIAGSASGTSALTVTAGDVIVSDGQLAVTRTGDNAVAFSVTNNTATTASVIALAGSGVFTGSTTTSFMTLTASGLTTGTVLYAPAAALTTGKVLHTVVNAMTTGTVLTASSTSAVLTSGKFIDLTWNPATYTGAGITTAGLVAISDAPTISTTVAGSHNDLNVTRTNTTAAAVITYSVSGSLVKINNASPTIGAGSTLTDTAVVLDVQQNNASSTGAAISVTDAKAAGTGNLSLSITANSLTNTTGALTLSTTGLTSGSSVKVTGGGANMTAGGKVVELAMGAATDGAGLSIVSTGIYTGTVGLLAVTDNSLTTGNLAVLSATGQTSGTVLTVTGGGANITTGALVSLAMGAATAGQGLIVQTSGVYTGTGIISLVANSLTTGIALGVSATGITTGSALSINLGAGVYTGTGAFSMTGSGATSGVVMLVSNSGVMTGAGQIAQFTAAGASNNTTVFGITANAATSSTLLSVSGTGLTSGVGVKVTATAATLTTGAYFQANDGGVNVFAVGLNGHLQSRQTTKPTIAVTQQNGITAAAITAGSTDTVGVITTTGTNNNAGTSILQVSFGKAYAVAPRVVLTAVNASGAGPNPPFISAQTTTTFDITIPASASAGATPSWNYMVIEMGS